MSCLILCAGTRGRCSVLIRPLGWGACVVIVDALPWVEKNTCWLNVGNIACIFVNRNNFNSPHALVYIYLVEYLLQRIMPFICGVLNHIAFCFQEFIFAFH